ncbi:MAG: SprB repeat-containing protein [Bacteroidota bacterium]
MDPEFYTFQNFPSHRRPGNPGALFGTSEHDFRRACGKPAGPMLTACLAMLFLAFFILPGQSQTVTIPAGSFIINMGVTPQTVANGLKPYGMIYEIVKTDHGAVVWSINPAKAKDGIDFSYGGVDYKGGTFIVPADYRTIAVNSTISSWTASGVGVVGVTTTAPITVPLFATLKSMPNWTLDYQNGAIAEAFLVNAGIPGSAYGGSDKSGWKTPAQLTCCDDLFVMPHADPTWATHSNLLTWNQICKGGIWLGCHAGSALSDMFNPSNTSVQTNFLSAKTGTPVCSGTSYCQNSLVLWSNHAAGSIPYSYNYPADPIMQFMGTIDAAQQNGSEQVYLPVIGGGWNSGAKIYVWDPTQSNVPALSAGPAATLVSGFAFDDSNRGRVMMEAAHNIANGTGTANVAAQRAFFNFSFYATNEKAAAAALSIGTIPSPLYAGVGQTVSFTFSGTVSNYNILWQSACGGTFTPNATSQTVTYTPPVVSGPTTCIISVTLTDKTCPAKVFTDNQSVQIACSLTVTTTLTNPCYGSSNGVISMGITGGSPVYNWNWALAGGGTGSGSGTSITGLAAGAYSVTVTANGGAGCSKTFTATLTQSPAVAVTATPSPALCNGSATGGVNVTVSGGTPGYSYLWAGGATTQNLNGLTAGTYQVTVTDSKGCTGTASPVVTQPASLVVTPTPGNINCYGQNTGTITLAVSGGTGTKTYLWNDGASTANRSNLAVGTYTVTVTDQNGCKQTASSSVSQPSTAISTSATSVNVVCNGGSTGSIDLSVSGGSPGYTYAWSNGATTQDISGLTAGNYTVTATDTKGCTSSLSKTITQAGSMTLGTGITNNTCPSPAAPNGAITLTVNGGTSPFNYDWADVSGTNNSQNRSGLAAGSYTVTVTDGNNCTATTTATITTLHGNPVPPTHINN